MESTGLKNGVIDTVVDILASIRTVSNNIYYKRTFNFHRIQHGRFGRQWARRQVPPIVQIHLLVWLTHHITVHSSRWISHMLNSKPTEGNAYAYRGFLGSKRAKGGPYNIIWSSGGISARTASCCRTTWTLTLYICNQTLVERRPKSFLSFVTYPSFASSNRWVLPSFAEETFNTIDEAMFS